MTGIKIISREDLENAEKNDFADYVPTEKTFRIYKAIEANDLEEAMEKFDNPIMIQKELAAKMKVFVDRQINTEMITTGRLSNLTRMWIKDVLEVSKDLQIQMHGTKNLNVNVDINNINHSQIANKLRAIKNKSSM